MTSSVRSAVTPPCSNCRCRADRERAAGSMACGSTPTRPQLDRGMSCEGVGRVLLIDDDTIRTWHRLFEEDGVDGLAGFNYGGRACQLTLEQQEKLKGG